MRLVEGIEGKGLPVLPYFLQNRFRVPALCTARGKLGLHLVENCLNFFTHGLAQHVGFALGESGQFLRELHNLLLIDRDSVGFLEKLLHSRNVVGDGFGTVLSANEAWDVLHWARTVERVHGNQISKDCGLEVLEVLLHPKGFVLKNTHRVAPLKELVGCHVVERNGLNVNFDSVALAHQLHAVLDQGEGFESQEVHLKQSRRLYRRVVKLGGPHRAFFGRGHRYDLANVAWRYNYPAGMDSQIPQRSLEHLSLLEGCGLEVIALGHFAQGNRLVVVFVAELIADGRVVRIQKNLQRGVVGHGLRQFVGVVVGKIQGAACILYGGFCRHGSVGDDLSNLV